MSSSSFSFDELPRGTGGTGATEAINQVLHDAGLDAPASLYDEALALAREGRMAPSAERLRMLLVLDPSDAEAALLLGKVLAGMARWQEALTWLDAAGANGAVLPAGLRDEVADSLRREVQDAEAERQRLQARERGEVRSLRAEAKRLRAETSVMEQQVMALDKRVHRWSSATALVAGCASALLIAAMLFGSPDAPTGPVTGTASALATTNAGAPEAGPIDVVAQPTAAVADKPAPKVAPVADTLDPKPVDKTIATHKVAPGENLSVIAQKYYGKSSQWKKVLAANEDVLHGDHRKLRPGQKLRIPE